MKAEEGVSQGLGGFDFCIWKQGFFLVHIKLFMAKCCEAGLRDYIDTGRGLKLILTRRSLIEADSPPKKFSRTK